LSCIIQPDADVALDALNEAGIDAYRGATQLDAVEPDIESDLTREYHQVTTPSCLARPEVPRNSVAGICESNFVSASGTHATISTLAAPTHPTLTSSNRRSREESLNLYPSEAKYLIDHVIYLPINKTVPMSELERLCDSLVGALTSACGEGESKRGTGERSQTTTTGRVIMKSKL